MERFTKDQKKNMYVSEYLNIQKKNATEMKRVHTRPKQENKKKNEKKTKNKKKKKEIMKGNRKNIKKETKKNEYH